MVLGNPDLNALSAVIFVRYHRITQISDILGTSPPLAPTTSGLSTDPSSLSELRRDRFCLRSPSCRRCPLGYAETRGRDRFTQLPLRQDFAGQVTQVTQMARIIATEACGIADHHSPVGLTLWYCRQVLPYYTDTHVYHPNTPICKGIGRAF